MAPFFMDYEAFQHGSGKTIIKELCIVDVDQPMIPLYFLFHNDKKWSELDSAQQKTYKYQTQYIHHLNWNVGTSRYCRECVYYYIKKSFPDYLNGIFYVMGEQKLTYLKSQFPSLNFCTYNVTFNDLPKLAVNIGCMDHEHGEHCACKKCYRLLHHYLSLPL